MNEGQRNHDYEKLRAEADAMAPPNRRAPIGCDYLILNIEMGLRRSWPYDKRPADGSWFAVLDVGPLRSVWRCNHSHDDAEEAWRCAKLATRLLVDENKDPNDWDWPQSPEGYALVPTGDPVTPSESTEAPGA